MDSYGEETHELSASLITMQFGAGGRVTQLWSADPELPEEGEEFQFVLPPLTFGEETVEDLFPGTILIGARTNPDEPWIFSRNNNAQNLFQLDEDDGFDLGTIAFDYDFPMIPEIQAKGKFYEVGGTYQQVIWELEISNKGKIAVEIGELGFPMPLNTFYDGFGWNDEQLKKLWNSRLYVHKYIGGAGSWIFAQRMTSEPPGLLIFPGDDRGWEFFASIPGSINTPFQWEGIPVVYAYSRATVEREGWDQWWNEHTSLILEPGDSRTFKIVMVPTDRDRADGVNQVLAACGRPAIRVLPSAVAPVDVGIAVEVQGTTPKNWYVSREAEMQTDSDDEGGFCFVRPKEPGRMRVSFEDKEGRLSHVHLMFTEPMGSLIRKRADYIAKHQVHSEPGSILDGAILLTNCATNERVTDMQEFSGASGIECSLADTLYLAEKNTIYPDRHQIAILDRYIQEFLLDDVQNPGDMSVGSVFPEGDAVAAYAGRPLTYPAVFSLYHAMARIAQTYGETAHKPEVYLQRAAYTAIAMFKFGWRNYVRTVGILGYGRIYDIMSSLRKDGHSDLADTLEDHVRAKAEEVVSLQYPYAGESILDTSGFEEVYRAAMYLDDDEHLERTMRCAFAARSLAPSWWWYGSDKRSWDGADSAPRASLLDRGEACLAHTTIPNTLMFFTALDRDYPIVPDVYMRLAFGGMMGPWALVRNDGAASMCYCPDPSSKHFGYNIYTGASGLGYFHYLSGVGSYVLPNAVLGTFSFGCHFESENGQYIVRPWDGVGRKVVLRQIDAEFHLTFGKMERIALDHRKRSFSLDILNPSDKSVPCELRIKGLWGTQVMVQGRACDVVDGQVIAPLVLPAGQVVNIDGRVIG